jgi:hypothetical protein
LSLVLLLEHLLLLGDVLVALLHHGEQIARFDKVGVGIGNTCGLHLLVALEGSQSPWLTRAAA